MKLLIYFMVLSLSVWGIRSRESKMVTSQADSSEAVTDWLSISGPLRFGNTSFSLAWSDKPNDTYYVQEYLPEGENVDRFKQMLTLNLFNTPVAVGDAVSQKVAELKERKTTDPYCNYAINQSKDGKEYMVDFLLSEGAGDKAIAEFNIYRYKEIAIAGKTQALLVYAYSKRSYGNDISGFLTNLKSERPALLQMMSVIQLPPVTISGK